MLTVDVDHHPDDTALIAAAGEVDKATAARLSTALHRELDRQPKKLVLDLGKVTFLGVAGLHVLMCAAERASVSSIPLQLLYRKPSPVQAALEAGGMAEHFGRA
jgi:anti-sigma B factor antagonist